MVYCTKCGAKNEDDALVCVKCGASLEIERYPARRYERRPWEQECFGIPQGGTVVVLVIGIVIFLAGFFWMISQPPFNVQTPEVGAIAMIVFAILIIVGALYKYGRR